MGEVWFGGDCDGEEVIGEFVLLDEMPVYNTKCLILWRPWVLQIGVPVLQVPRLLVCSRRPAAPACQFIYVHRIDTCINLFFLIIRNIGIESINYRPK